MMMPMLSWKLRVSGVIVCMTIVALCSAQETKPAAGPKVKGPLAGLPSAPGKHIEKIKSLGDNAWLQLGSPAPDPKWGQARGRSWTAKMPLAGELRGAFLAGLGVHGFVKPDGHYQDDLWFYDINAHRWICCHPGSEVKKLDLTINRDGFEATRDGELLPVAWLGHGYELNAYDPEAKRFVSMPCGDPYWEAAMPQRKGWLKPEPKDASPWFYELSSGRWDRVRTGTPGPACSFGDLLYYVPTKKQYFFAHRSSDVWFYNPKAKQWKSVEPSGPKPPFGIDPTCCYDAKRDRIYVGGGGYPTAPEGTNAFWIYDLKQDAWIDPKPKGAPCKGSTGYSTVNAVMLYDTVNDVVLLVYHSFNYSKAERLGVYVYDPNANAWSEGLALPDKLGKNREVKNGFYDPELNAVFIHSAGDSRDGGVMWAYRYKSTP